MSAIFVARNSRLSDSTAGSLILKMSYGYDVQEDGDPCVEAVGLALDQFSKLSQPGAFLVDVAPVLRYVPSWLPGAGFKKTAEMWHKTLMEAVDMPYNLVKRRLVRELPLDYTAVKLTIHILHSEHISISDNFTSDLLERGELDDDKDQLIKWSAALLYGGEYLIKLYSKWHNFPLDRRRRYRE